MWGTTGGSYIMRRINLAVLGTVFALGLLGGNPAWACKDGKCPVKDGKCAECAGKHKKAKKHECKGDCTEHHKPAEQKPEAAAPSNP
jgi:hypothetical protein